MDGMPCGRKGTGVRHLVIGIVRCDGAVLAQRRRVVVPRYELQYTFYLETLQPGVDAAWVSLLAVCTWHIGADEDADKRRTSKPVKAGEMPMPCGPNSGACFSARCTSAVTCASMTHCSPGTDNYAVSSAPAAGQTRVRPHVADTFRYRPAGSDSMV
jgi:hypothetical protein